MPLNSIVSMIGPEWTDTGRMRLQALLRFRSEAAHAVADTQSRLLTQLLGDCWADLQCRLRVRCQRCLGVD
jgi:hypothetical protein